MSVGKLHLLILKFSLPLIFSVDFSLNLNQSLKAWSYRNFLPHLVWVINKM
ncbi:hypothetical protein DB41_HW00140 [Neochlamydia sp. TUME1]|nr:hypothetical protein DB41_HW00140 [Neochlamydia sp. TUME1]